MCGLVVNPKILKMGTLVRVLTLHYFLRGRDRVLGRRSRWLRGRWGSTGQYLREHCARAERGAHGARESVGTPRVGSECQHGG
jgi:hypothetical protein